MQSHALEPWSLLDIGHRMSGSCGSEQAERESLVNGTGQGMASHQ